MRAPLIVVAVGTDHHPFDRLVRWVERWGGARDVRLVIQHGTAARPVHAQGATVLPADELRCLMREAAAVVCHGGPGTITLAREAGLIPIVVARRAGLGEHVDDHQVRFVARLAGDGAILAPDSEAGLHTLLDRAVTEPGAFATGRIDRATDVARSVGRFGRLVDDLVEDRPAGGGIPVLFVAGWGRSGSTLFARMLGQVPGVFSAGELRDVWLRGAIEDRLCGCGVSFRSCELWCEVGERAFGGWDQLDLGAVQRLRERLDRPWLPARLAGGRIAPGLDADTERYRELLGRLYTAIAEVTGAALIVDPSKIPTYSMLLRGVPELDLRVVHLVRDSRGVVRSWQRRVDRADRPGDGEDDQLFRYGTLAASARYGYYNGLAHGLRALGVPSAFLRYEDLVADPRSHLTRILSFAGRPVVDDDLAFTRDGLVELGSHHTVDGNPMRLTHGPIPIRVDDAWRRDMPPAQRAVVSLLTAPLLAAYGYPLRG